MLKSGLGWPSMNLFLTLSLEIPKEKEGETGFLVSKSEGRLYLSGEGMPLPLSLVKSYLDPNPKDVVLLSKAGGKS